LWFSNVILAPSANSRQALPLVTITEENEEALSNREFAQMLKKIGFVPPANEQVRSPSSKLLKVGCVSIDGIKLYLVIEKVELHIGSPSGKLLQVECVHLLLKRDI
jgi:hypothetical protein